MEGDSKKRRRKCYRGYEENTMAMIDYSGVKEARDVEDDRLSFLEAIRSGSIVSENRSAPTRKMFEAIFQILRDETSLELIVSSYQLLLELDKLFPRVYSFQPLQSKSSSSTAAELVVAEEAWSPFVFGLENAYSEKEASSTNFCDPLDSYSFFLLTQGIAQAVSVMDSQLWGIKALREMTLFQYLVSVLEGDFLPRQTVYKETKDWALVRESLLHMLLGSRRINFKILIKECMSIISKGSKDRVDMNPCELKKEEKVLGYVAGLALAVTEHVKQTHVAMQKFLALIMELDEIKKEAYTLGHTSRADGSRTPLLEVILDDLTYNKDLLSPFLQGFSDPKWKLKIVLQYFSKYCIMPSSRMRRSKVSAEDATFESVLKCFSNSTSTRNIVRKVSIEVAQTLLAYCFQAYLSVWQCQRHLSSSDASIGSGNLVQVCSDVISAFRNLKKIDEQTEFMPFEKEALFTAATILSTIP